jgi:flagellar assembly protein FliH
LSNVIKAYSVRYDVDIKKTIDSHLRIDQEIAQRKSIAVMTNEDNGEFTQGIKAIVVDQLPSPEEEKEKTSKVIEDAKNEARHILDQARQEAEQIKADSFASAQKKGYEEGLQQSSRQTQKLAAEYMAKTKNLQKEYDEALNGLEPKMVEIIASLIGKITGIMTEDKEDVILYMVNRALNNLDKSNEYTIRVSKEDYDYLTERKGVLLNAIGREVNLVINEDPELTKNQCLIETDTHVIDCSLDVQLNNLITDLKLLCEV